jgi:hypothetical protein
MPKRILDGEGVWRSDKLRRVEEWARSEYANLIPLAMANGVFECSSSRVWSLVYSYNRQEVTIGRVKRILKELESCGLLFRWKNDDGKKWAYFVGIEKPGRLPGKSRRGKHENVGPMPPAFQLAEYKSKTREECGLVYFLRGARTGMVKIGYSRAPFERMRMHQESSPDILSMDGVMIGPYALEGELHRRFKQHRSHGEWFHGADELLQFIETNKVKNLDVSLEDFGIQKLPCFGSGIGSGTGIGNGDGEPKKSAAASSTPEIFFQTPRMTIQRDDHEKLQALFPIFDVKAYYPEMDFWLKQAKELRPNSALFARNWLKREAENLGRNARSAEVHVGNGSGAQRSSARPPETDACTAHPMDPNEMAPVRARVFIWLVDARDMAKIRRDTLWMEGCSAAMREMHGD